MAKQIEAVFRHAAKDCFLKRITSTIKSIDINKGKIAIQVNSGTLIVEASVATGAVSKEAYAMEL